MKKNMNISGFLGKSVKFLCLAATVIAGFACDRNEMDGESELEGELEKVVLTFSKADFVNADGTKSVMNGNNVVWEAGDQIALYITGGFYSNRYDLTLVAEDAGKTEGRFEGDIKTGTGYNYCAIYPAGATISRNSSTLFLLDMPATQVYAASGVASGANISTILIPSTSLTSRYLTKALNFSNTFGMLRLNITGTSKISKIEIMGSKSAQLAGVIGLDVDNFNAGGAMTVRANAANMVTLDCSAGGGVQLTSEGVDFNILLPPSTLADGFTVNIYDTDGLTMTKQAEAHTENAIERNVITKMPQFAYVPQYSQIFTGSYFAGTVTNYNSKSAAVAENYGADGNQTSFDGADFYIQNLEEKFIVKFNMPYELTIGTVYDIKVENVLGTSPYTEQTLHLKYIGSDEAFARFVDESTSIGYTFNCQL